MDSLLVYMHEFCNGKREYVDAETASWKDGKYAFAGIHYDPAYGKYIVFAKNGCGPIWADVEYTDGSKTSFCVDRAYTDRDIWNDIVLEPDMEDTDTRIYVPFEKIGSIRIHP